MTIIFNYCRVGALTYSLDRICDLTTTSRNNYIIGYSIVHFIQSEKVRWGGTCMRLREDDRDWVRMSPSHHLYLLFMLHHENDSMMLAYYISLCNRSNSLSINSYWWGAIIVVVVVVVTLAFEDGTSIVYVAAASIGGKVKQIAASHRTDNNILILPSINGWLMSMSHY